MQQTQRFIHSVSDLYITDEIDLLLEEIKDLEPACYQIEDLQDFDIGMCVRACVCVIKLKVKWITNTSFACSLCVAGSRADELSLPIEELESPIGTISSWDSHINYRHHMNQAPLAWGVALHCNAKHFKSRTGIVRLVLLVSETQLETTTRDDLMLRPFISILLSF